MDCRSSAAITETHLAVNAAELGGNATARVRVMASDGINTASTDSGTFTVGRKPPEALILVPESAVTITVGAPLLLQGSAYDREDGTLASSALRWRSSLEGDLGTGEEKLVMLSPGKHVLTLTATDSNAMTGTATTTVTVSALAPLYVRRVNAGGASVHRHDGLVWAADKAFAAGSWGYTGGAAGTTTAPISKTLDDKLYQSYRIWPASATPGYRFTVPNGRYEVRLKFAEPGATAAGQRRFSVKIEGATVLSNYDIFAAAGGKNIAAPDKVFTVNVARR